MEPATALVVRGCTWHAGTHFSCSHRRCHREPFGRQPMPREIAGIRTKAEAEISDTKRNLTRRGAAQGLDNEARGGRRLEACQIVAGRSGSRRFANGVSSLNITPTFASGM